MSNQPTQPSKPNWINMILVFLVVFLGVQLLFPKQQAPAEKEETNRASVVAEMRKFYDKPPGDAATLTKKMEEQLTKLNRADNVPSGILGFLQRGREKKSPERLEGWLLYTAALERKGMETPGVDGSKLLDQADLKYQAIMSSYPGRYAELSPKYREIVGTVTLDEKLEDLHAELNKRYAVADRYWIGAGYQTMHWLVSATGAVPWFSYAFAVMVVALVVRLLMWPFSQASYRYMRQMKAVQPLIERLKERYEGMELMEKQRALMKRAGINQLAGCMGMLLPFPFLIWMYHVMRAYRFEFQKGWFLWINPSFSEGTNGFIAPDLGSHDYIIIVAYAISMYVTQRMMVMDPTQERQQQRMSLIMTAVLLVMFMTWKLPSAFILYWLFFNIFSTAQQVWVNKQPIPEIGIELPELPDASKNGKGKGVPKQHRHRSGSKKRRR